MKREESLMGVDRPGPFRVGVVKLFEVGPTFKFAILVETHLHTRSTLLPSV